VTHRISFLNVWKEIKLAYWITVMHTVDYPIKFPTTAEQALKITAVKLLVEHIGSHAPFK
jgi:hypothetical protein